MPESTGTRKKSSKSMTSDVYTAMLGFALLALLATAGWMCFSAWTMFGTIFTIS